MTATVLQVTIQAVMSSHYGALTTGLGIVVVVLLIALLIERALVEVYGGPRSMDRIHAFNAVVGPLLLIFGILVALRLIQGLHLF